MGRPPGRTRLVTYREQIYLTDAANGLTASESARKRGVSVNTVNTMRRSAQLALGADNITHAVTLAIFHGEITLKNLKGTQS